MILLICRHFAVILDVVRCCRERFTTIHFWYLFFWKAPLSSSFIFVLALIELYCLVFSYILWIQCFGDANISRISVTQNYTKKYLFTICRAQKSRGIGSNKNICIKLKHVSNQTLLGDILKTDGIILINTLLKCVMNNRLIKSE